MSRRLSDKAIELLIYQRPSYKGMTPDQVEARLYQIPEVRKA